MNWKVILTATFLGLSSQFVSAQLSESVTVEGEYMPLIIETERLNTFPSGYKFELPPANVEYDFEGVTTEFRPNLLTMGVTGRFADWPGKKRRGFVDFRLGSWLNSRLHAGYDVISDSVNTLSAELNFRSSSLYRMAVDAPDFTRLPRKRYYDGGLGLNYGRLIGREGLLNASLGYRLAYFNYYGTSVRKSLLPMGMEAVDIPTQTVNNLRGSVSYVSSPSYVRGWHASARADYFAYRSLYLPVISGGRGSGARETDLKLGGGYRFALGDHGAIAVDAEGRFLFLNGNDISLLGLDGIPVRNYGIISLNPGYRYSNKGFRLHAGLDIDFSYDAMGAESGRKFGAVHLAPDVTLSYTGKSFGVAFQATGGVSPSTLSEMEKFDLYGMPAVVSTLPVYSPVDARLQFTVGPFAGFEANAGLRFAIARNVPLGGWYQAFLGSPVASVPDTRSYLDPYSRTLNLSGVSAEMKLRYSFGSIVGLSVDATYTPQSGKRGIFNGFDRPRWTLDAKAEVRPIRNLAIEVGYDYRGVRNCYAWTETIQSKELVAFRLPDVTNLNAKITYTLFDRFDIYVKGDNLINCHPWLLPGLGSEGVVVQGGFYFEF